MGGSFISEIVHHSDSNNKGKPMLYCDRWVWLQGFMVDIAEDCDVFQISDHVPEPEASISQATTCVLVVNCNRTAGKIDKSTKGKYFQVLGEVRGFDKVHRNLQVSAIKIANLSKLGNCEVLKSMWRNENTEARKLEKNCLLFKQQ